MSEVGTLLEQARAAHRRYREQSGRIGKDGKMSRSPDLWSCGEAVRAALSARVDADRLDPQRVDAAWREDLQAMKASHEELVGFYAAYLTPRV